MAKIIRCIAEEIAPGLKAISDPVLGSPTISIGTVRGGTKTNIVPDHCQITVDLRTIPGQDIRSVLAQIRAACPDAILEITQSSPPLLTEPNHPLIDVLKQNGVGCVTAPWFCDAAEFSAAEIPAIAAGPGSIAQAHTEDEWITIDDLERGVDFYRSFLEKLKC
jgi:acetylornithine deacetylase/succinyl-diaminopimelate desuccinylase-like protein